MLFSLSFIFVLILAYANGANDNFKGVATLFGSGTADYKRALLWAAGTTAAGSFTALLLAGTLLKTFTGKGLVPPDVLAMPSFPMAVGLAAACTVMLATRLGFPISTTHSLVGALVGAGLAASPAGIDWARLMTVFFGPLLASPILAIAGTAAIYPLFRFARRRLDVEKETCLCVGDEIVGVIPVAAPGEASAAAMMAVRGPSLAMGAEAKCVERYKGKVVGISAGPALDAAHYLSAGAVGFARGLNDTPKIAAILLAGAAFPKAGAIALVAVAMAAGGILSVRRVAETLSHKITTMNAGQGFTANLMTAGIVIFASRLGVPVSTTHVSCGSLFGLGAVTGGARWKMIAIILAAWVTTLPVAAALGALFFITLR